MAGNVIGGLKSAITNKQRHGSDFYKRMGQVGGKRSNNGGFGSDKVGADGLTGQQRACVAGRIGGRQLWTPAHKKKHSELMKRLWAAKKARGERWS